MGACARRCLRRAVVAIAGAGMMVSPAAMSAAQLEATWNGGTGNWNVPGNWTPSGIPNNGADTYLVRIDGGKEVNSIVTLNQLATVDGVNINAGDTLQVGNQQALTIATNAVVNNGTVEVTNIGGGFTRVQFSAPVTLQGSGHWVLSNNAQNRFGPLGGLTTLNALGTIRGAGTLEMGVHAFSNQGLVRQEGSNALIIANGAGGFSNPGLLEGSGAGGLFLQGGIFTNTGGEISALDGSFVQVGPSTTILGGELTTAGSGQIRAFGTGGTTPLLDGVQINNSYLQPSFQNTRIRGTIVNSGIWTINHIGGAFTDLLPEQDALLTGSGEVVMGTNTSARIVMDTSSFTNNTQHTIRGTGQILANGGEFVNKGVVRHVGAGSLTITTGAGSVTNESIIESTVGLAADAMILRDGTFNNTEAGEIRALGTGIVQLGPTALFSGGELSTTESGILRLESLGAVSGAQVPVLQDLTINGNIVQPTITSAAIRGTITNNGLWTTNHFSGSFSDITAQNGAVLQGIGSIFMSGNNPNGRFVTDATVITHEAGHTIRGRGQVVVIDGGKLINKGLIRQEGDQTPLGIIGLGTGTLENRATMEAAGAGKLVISPAHIENQGGLIRALDTRTVQIGPSALVRNGTVRGVGTGVIEMNSAGAFNGPTVPILEDVLLEGTVNQPNINSAIIRGTITNNANWTTNHISGSVSDITAQNGAVLQGIGNIFMNGNTLGRFVTDASVITHEAGHTIRGRGQVVVIDGGTLINKGLIRQEGEISLSLSRLGTGILENRATMEASGAGRLIITTAEIENEGGLIQALDTRVAQVGPTALVRNGTLRGVETGLIELNSAGNFNGPNVPILEDVLLEGLVNQPNINSVILRGTITNNAVWTTNHISGSVSDIYPQNGAVLEGNGSIFMAGNNAGRVVTDDSIITHEAGHTIRGGGQVIAIDGGTLINKGLIRQEGNTSLIISRLGSGTLENMATMEATGFGKLLVTNALIENEGGLIQALDTRTAQIGPVALVKNGTLRGVETGRIEFNSNTFTSGANVPILEDVKLEGLIFQPNISSAAIRGTIINDGLWTLNHVSGGTSDVLALEGAVLAGSGDISMNGGLGNRVVTDGTTLIQEAGHTIRGNGVILAGTGGMINRGTVRHEGLSSLTIQANELGFVNEGQLESVGLGTGLFIADGARFTNAGDTFVETGRNLTVTTGNYVQTGGETQVNGTLTLAQVGASAQINGGVLSGTGNITRSVANAATVAPGTSAGILTVTQAYNQSPVGSLAVELGGVAVGTQYDRLNVVGAATLAGRLDVSTLGDYVPAPGNTFTVLTAASRTGEFDVVTGALVAPGLLLEKSYTPTSAVLTTTVYEGLAVDDVFVTEDEWGTTDAVFTLLQFPANPTQTVQVTVATEDGTATAAGDYIPLAPTVVSFAPGETTKQVTVKVLNDGQAEGSEYFKLVLSGAVNSTIAKEVGVGVIAEGPGFPREDRLFVY